MTVTADQSSYAKTIPLLSATEEDLLRLSKQGMLSLSLQEMRAIQAHYKGMGRDPSDIELETLAQTWSEHCKHKTFKGLIEYKEQGPDGDWKSRVYDDLLKETVIKATRELNRPYCLSVFKDNAGVIAFDDDFGIAFKVETHNHPSALEPYGGAGTGIGGVIRDIMGVGLGAKPVLNTDVFAFPPADMPVKSLPAGVLHPRRIIEGVVAGVRDYGNRMGIPTANGAVVYDERYAANPLVFCGTVGFIPISCVDKEVRPSDYIVALGGRTGRDGIHGATFSSAALEQGISSSVVQIGHAIMEKKTMDVLLQARDRGLFRAVTDCGAGGFSSAVGELGAECGARVALEKAPLKYAGLAPWEIWISESQERMVLAVPPDRWQELKNLCVSENVEATRIGEFTSDGKLSLEYQGVQVGRLDMAFLHDGMPRVSCRAVWKRRPASLALTEPKTDRLRLKSEDYSRVILSLLSHPNIASKRWIINQYDHEVQGGSVIKPLLGMDQSGPSDATVFQPRPDSWRGVAVSNGLCPRYSDLDPYWMAANAIDEALRNLVAVGGSLERAAILDNFCWGDPMDEEELGGLVRASQACYDLARAYGVPFISGKDSLNNTWRDHHGKSHSIPGTLLISAISVVDDVRRTCTMSAKKAGHLIYLVGDTREELGGSHFFELMKRGGGSVPRVLGDRARSVLCGVHEAIWKGLVKACHDLSEGGLAVAAAEMAFAGNIGLELSIERLPMILTGEGASPDMIGLFSESATRFLVEVEPGKRKIFERTLGHVPFALIGKTTTAKKLVIRSHKGDPMVALGIPQLLFAWQKGGL